MRLILLLLSALLLTSCVDELGTDINVKSPITEEDCDGEILCTMELRIFSVTLIDKNGESIVLDEDKVSAYYTDSEEEKEVYISEFGETTYYEIASDNDDKKIDFSGTSITFEAKISPFKTIKREYIFAKDCCHVYSPESQNFEIVVD